MKKTKNFFMNENVVKFLIFSFLILVGFAIGTGVGKGNVVVPFNLDLFVNAKNISSNELKKEIASKDFVLINVHTPYAGEIKNTDAFIEHDLIKANSDNLPKDKNTKIVLYCNSGRMSKEAQKTLLGMGYTNVYSLSGGMKQWKKEGNELLDLSNLPDKVLPGAGFTLPFSLGVLGPRMVSLGIIDETKFRNAVSLNDVEDKTISKGTNDALQIDSSNSQFVVDLLWAFGLAQKSEVYDKGPMGTTYKDSVGNFASTGGWTLAKGNALNYLNKYNLITLDEKQQERVSEIAKNVYRPCCGNNTWFPDCNHGMAALGAIEIMVSKNLPDDEIYSNLLKLNSYWFPDTYLSLATYFARRGTMWNNVDAKEVLGEVYSSAQGAGKIMETVGRLPYQTQKGGSCGA